MENKTQHLRRMRLRRKYWRVTPTSERITINPKGANEMCNDRSDYDADIPAVAAAARAMLAALQAITDSADSVVDSWEHGDLAGAVNMLDADRDTAREAIAAALAAGIGGK
jgi:hypothetical protein